MNVILRNRAFPLLQTRAFDSNFERLVGGLLENAPLAPRMNVVDTGAAYRIEAELPGVTREEIRISVDKRRVSIDAESTVANEVAEGEKALLTERRSHKYSRVLTLAGEVEDAEAVAKFENGVLTLTLPKKAADQPKQIAVQ
ncbi:Hsp20/alpha crystallin family protein [Noviherbaspirillum suwonense]|jgi:HSP20 family protein|uniref:Heat shock protein Hsp20 n=1 Tax=Noviherbaspirillum suwonense TaxID=1224511 RepID=A0ABY1QND8_9BURK|nr:Hsp20/alpha crystallin family protein [Noviherbaspirillum suwonense]SMP75645.1 heat shock protein Hsp20 [Noviherbaspirillum suwonense]